MSNFKGVFIIIFLCIVVLLISGILLPKYLSTEILEIRKELNSQISNSKYNLQANLVPIEKDIQSKVSTSSRNTDEFPSALNSILPSEKLKNRSKRQAVTDDEHFHWKFNLNLTGQRNYASHASPQSPLNTTRKDKHLGIALFTEGEAEKKSAFAEIQNSLRAIEFFLKYIFTTKNFTDETINGFARSDVDLELEGGSGDDTLVRGREGKFFDLRKLFGFRTPPEKSVSTSTTSTVPETKSTFKRDDLVMTQSPTVNIITENSETPNLSHLQSQSLVSESLNVENKSSISESNLPGKTEDGECIDCNAAGVETLTSKSVDQTKIATVSTEFTDEFLEMFCMRLVNKVGVSQHLSDSEELSFEHKQSIIDEHDILSSSKRQIAHFLPTSISEKELNPEFTSEAFIMTNDTRSESEMRQKKFLSVSSIFGFGSGRAAVDIDESDELTSETFANVDLANLPTLLDCENYFREKKLKMFPKPNQMDGIKPKIEFANATISTTNAEIQITSTDVGEAPQVTDMERDSRFVNIFGFGSGNGESRSLGTDDFDTDRNEILGSGHFRSSLTLIDQQQFVTSLLNVSLDNSLETFDKNSNGVGTESATDEIMLENDRLTLNKEPKEISIHTEPNNLSGNIEIIITSTDIGEATQVTKLERDGRINIFGFGSGNDESRSLGTDVFVTDRNEILGSGDLRSFETVGVGRNGVEFGSGDIRSLQGSLFETEFGSGDSRSIDIGRDRNEFGSGDSRSLLDALFGTNKNEFGSGDSKSLKDETFQTESSEFGSGDSFKETSNFVTETYDDLTSIYSNKQLFGGMLELEGSGDGRDLPENLVSNDSKTTLPIELVGVNQVTAGANLETSSNPTSVESLSIPENASDTQNVAQVSQEQTIEKNSQRFLVPILLTGSGEGGLFEDSGETINLLEEESTVKSEVFSLRKGRLDDSPNNRSEVLSESSPKQSEQVHSVDGNANKEKLTSPIIPLRRGRMEETTDELCDDCDYSYEDFIENYRKKQSKLNDSSKFEKRTNSQSDVKMPFTNENVAVTALPDVIQNVTIITSPNVIQSNITVFPDFTKVSQFRRRSCTAARECNVTLNERCVTINSSRICGCSKGYARNKETNKCIVMKIVETSIKLPSESFEDDLKNPFSPGFQQKRKSAIELVMLLLQNDPELLRVLSEINVEFSSGSLVVKLNLVFAAENKSQEQLIKHVEDDFLTTLRNETLMKRSSLDVSEASLVSVNGEIDYCKSTDLNYCSENAFCVPNPGPPSNYACYCKEHYRDASFDQNRMGETCIEKCPKDYCGAYGHCELLENDERICLCTGLYFGRRCEVPGLYVLIALAFVGFVSITMLFLVICKRRCSKFSYRQSQAPRTEENGIHSHMNGKVSDAIALEENIGTMKFVSISTPLPHPSIQITRPTVTESGSSYDFDSTFDSTPSMHKAEENSTV